MRLNTFVSADLHGLYSIGFTALAMAASNGFGRLHRALNCMILAKR